MPANGRWDLIRRLKVKIVSQDDSISFTKPVNNYSEYNIISFTPLIKIFQLSFHSSNSVIAFRYYDERVLQSVSLATRIWVTMTRIKRRHQHTLFPCHTQLFTHNLLQLIHGMYDPGGRRKCVPALTDTVARPRRKTKSAAQLLNLRYRTSNLDIDRLSFVIFLRRPRQVTR